MYNVQVISDLHLDQLSFYYNEELVAPKADILILGGDICHFITITKHQDFFNYISLNFQYILYIPGNHEFYNKNETPILELEMRAKTFFNKYENIIYLNNQSIFIEDILFTGSCLWCQPAFDPPTWFHINIKKEDIHKMYDKSVTYLEKISSVNYSKHVIITHYPPIYIDQRKHKKYGKYTDYYCNQNIVLTNQPKIWIFGHIHENIFKQQDGTMYISNQRKDKNYNNSFTIRI